MIPTLLVVGRWWLVPVAGVVWAVLVDAGAGAFALGTVNAAVGVAVHRGAVLFVRRLRRFLQDPMGSLGAG